MKIQLALFILIFLSTTLNSMGQTAEEKEGMLIVEAENYTMNESKGYPRLWVLTSMKDSVWAGFSDPDANHAKDSGGHSYLEALPDTRVTRDDRIENGESFYPIPGEGPTLSYQIKINHPGKYYVWCRAFSTGHEDNGLHVGIDGEWPESGARIQWCAGINQWTWSSAQRVPENHCGYPNSIYLDIQKKGLHTITFSMREDGMEFDQWMMTLDESYTPEKER
ncbi:MAG: hypothetical protein ACERKD_21590 [Prolixibacteraceae bacterium]